MLCHKTQIYSCESELEVEENKGNVDVHVHIHWWSEEKNKNGMVISQSVAKNICSP